MSYIACKGRSQRIAPRYYSNPINDYSQVFETRCKQPPSIKSTPLL